MRKTKRSTRRTKSRSKSRALTSRLRPQDERTYLIAAVALVVVAFLGALFVQDELGYGEFAGLATDVVGQLGDECTNVGETCYTHPKWGDGMCGIDKKCGGLGAVCVVYKDDDWSNPIYADELCHSGHCYTGDTLADANGYPMVIKGTCIMGEGESCIYDDQCANGECIEGECYVDTLGDSCKLDEDCTNHLKCGRDQICGGQGAACKVDEHCFSNVCDDGKCLQVLGGNCGSDSQCAQGTCEDGICSITVEMTPNVGAECSEDDDCYYGNCRYGACGRFGANCLFDDKYKDKVCISGKCAVEQIDAEDGHTLIAQGTCYRSLGQFCVHDTECATGRCSDERVCVPDVEEPENAVGIECTNRGEACYTNDDGSEVMCGEDYVCGGIYAGCVHYPGDDLSNPIFRDDLCYALVCSDEGMCVEPSPVEAGADCGSDADCIYHNCFNRKCGDYSSECTEDAACHNGRCVDGVCGYIEGETCGKDIQCASGFCDLELGECAELVIDEDIVDDVGLCTEDSDCESKLCEDGVCVVVEPSAIGVGDVCSMDTDCRSLECGYDNLCGGLDAACETGDECVTGKCYKGKCAPLVGTECDDDIVALRSDRCGIDDLFGGVGATCKTGAWCESEKCLNNRCIPRLGDMCLDGRRCSYPVTCGDDKICGGEGAFCQGGVVCVSGLCANRECQ